jgi:branched-chain amino acid transport system permease protein
MISIGNAGFSRSGRWSRRPGLAAAAAVPGSRIPLAGSRARSWVRWSLPALRIRGIYLLLATLGFHYAMGFLFAKYQIRARFGSVDYPGAGDAAWLRADTEIRWYYFPLGFAVFCSRSQRTCCERGKAVAVAVRDHEIAASMAGINVPYARIMSFSISSFMITAAGGIYGWYLGSVGADTFTLLFAIGFIAMIVIGGEGSLVGTVLGVIVWQFTPVVLEAGAEMSGDVSPGVKDWVTQWQTQLTYAIFGLLILVVMVYQPTGLAGVWARVKRTFVRWPYTT